MTCTFLCATFTISAQENSLLKEAGQKAEEGDYMSAAILYERVLFNAPTDADAYLAVTGRLGCLKKESRFREAERYIKASMFPGFTDQQRFELSVQQILCAYLAGQFENTVSLTEQLQVNFSDNALPELVAVMKVMSLNELGRWEDAAAAYREWAGTKDTSYLQNDPYKKLPRFKSESKAEWLSTFIPGGGQIYAGKPLEGMVSILVQGAGIWFGVVSFLDHYYLSAWAGAGLFGSFHMGGVRRSAVLVQRYNKKALKEFNEKVKTLMLGGNL